MVGKSNQNVFLIQIDVSNFAEFEISEFEISRFDCIFVSTTSPPMSVFNARQEYMQETQHTQQTTARTAQNQDTA